jgi:hypothetical protein
MIAIKVPAPPPWRKFAAGALSASTSEPFSDIAHVTHIDLALNILRQQIIRPQLVYDESKLNTERILVCWLSPNYWHNGFRYGNIMFSFDVDDLVRDNRCYWVESMPSYSPTACRILVTPNTYPVSSGLIPYDPKSSSGPWRFDAAQKKHYRNQKYTLEIMYEGELPLDLCTRVRFVQHHDSYCCISPTTCPDRTKTAITAGAEFVAGVIAGDIESSTLKFSIKKRGKKVPSHELAVALGELLVWPNNAACGGSVDADSDEGRAVARAIFAAIRRENKKERNALAQLFRSRNELITALTDLLIEKFSLDAIDLEDE